MNTSNFSKRKEGRRKNRIFKMFCETSSLKCIMFQLSYCRRFLVLKIKPEAFMIPLNFPMFPNNATLRSSLSDLSFPFWNQCWSLQFDWLSTERFNYDFFPLNRIVFLPRRSQNWHKSKHVFDSLQCNLFMKSTILLLWIDFFLLRKRITCHWIDKISVPTEIIYSFFIYFYI